MKNRCFFGYPRLSGSLFFVFLQYPDKAHEAKSVGEKDEGPLRPIRIPDVQVWLLTHFLPAAKRHGHAELWVEKKRLMDFGKLEQSMNILRNFDKILNKIGIHNFFFSKFSK